MKNLEGLEDRVREAAAYLYSVRELLHLEVITDSYRVLCADLLKDVPASEIDACHENIRKAYKTLEAKKEAV